jgi:hypothetical protein
MAKKALFLTFLVVLSMCIMYCGRSEQYNKADRKMKESESFPKREAAVIRFKTFRYIDKQGIGIEAFRILLPVEWQFEGGIRWVLDNPGMPAVASFKVRNPNGLEEFEVFPNQAFFWTNNPLTISLFPIGSRYFGNEVRPPVGALEALKTIVIQRFRQNVNNLRIVNEKHLPDLAKALGASAQSQPGVSTSSDGAKIRIEYDENGIAIEEEIYAVVELISFPIQTITGIKNNIIWFVDYIFSFKAKKGELDDKAKLLQTIAFSFQLNPQWFNKYNQVIEYLARRQIQQIQSIGHLSRIISQTSNEISDMMMDSYYRRQAVNDEISKNFSQYIRGVDEYYDPIEKKEVELPSGYRNAWTNSLGEYILTDDLSFNPNIGSTQNWQKMGKKQ